jgi:fatty acid-binding protein DegV
MRAGDSISTSQISPAPMRKPFRLAGKGYDVFYVCFSSGLSGTYQSSNISAPVLMERYPGRKVVISDSLAHLRQGLADLQAAKNGEAGMSIRGQRPLDRRARAAKRPLVHRGRSEFLKRGGAYPPPPPSSAHA